MRHILDFSCYIKAITCYNDDLKSKVEEFFNQQVFGKEVQVQVHSPFPKTLVIREAKSSGCGGILVGACSVVRVCVYGAP